MHLDIFRHLPQGQRAQCSHALAEKRLLSFQDRARHLDDGALALVHGLDQPVRLADAFADPALGGLVRASLHVGLILAIHQQPWQIGFVQFHPPAIRTFPDEHVRYDGRQGFAVEPAAGLGIISPQLGNHIGKIIIIHRAKPLEARKITLAQQLQIIDQFGHAGVITVRLPRLDGDTFRKIARADTGGIEQLHRLQHAFHMHRIHTQPRGNDVGFLPQIAAAVDLLDQRQRDAAVQRTETGMRLRFQMLVQGCLRRGHAIEIGAFARLRRWQRPAGARRAVAFGLVAACLDRVHALIRARLRRRVGNAALFLWPAAFARQQRIALHRFVQIGFDLEIGQREQFDGLLQLRGHDQRLGLA